MTTTEDIDITGCDLRTLVRKAYELSQPQGLGFLHFQPGGLTDAEVDQLAPTGNAALRHPVYLDYVKGRAVKLTVFQKDGRLSVGPRWYDHTPEQYAELIAAVKATIPATA